MKAMEKYRKTPEFAAHQTRVQEAKVKDTKKAFRKDENAPKRAQSAYFIWMNEVGRPAYTKAHPDADIGTVGKALGEEWKGMTKKTFQDKAEKAKKKYQTALAKYQKTPANRKYEEAKRAYKEEQSNKRKRLEGKDEQPAAKKAKAPKRRASASKSKSRSRSRSR